MSQSPARIVLERAKALIQDPKDWLQGGWTMTCPGGHVRRCAYQAVQDAATQAGLPDAAALKALTRVIADARRSPRRAIPMFNDTFEHADVMAMFDLAIQAV